MKNPVAALVGVMLGLSGAMPMAQAQRSPTVICGSERPDGSDSCRVEAGRPLKGQRGSFNRYNGKKVESQLAGYVAEAADKRAVREAEKEARRQDVERKKEAAKAVVVATTAEDAQPKVMGYDRSKVQAILDTAQGLPVIGE